MFAFRSCETRQCKNITILNDYMFEDNEFFTVHLEEPLSLSTRYTIDPAELLVIISDDDGKCIEYGGKARNVCL